MLDPLKKRALPASSAVDPVPVEKKSSDGDSADAGLNTPLGKGLAHTKQASSSPNALLDSLTDPRIKYAKELKGEQPFDAASYAAVTGISVDAAESKRLDALVKNVAQRIGLEHSVGFAAETKYMGRFFEFSFLGLFQGWDRPKQEILVGIGLKAKTVEDIELLYRYFNQSQGAPPALLPMFEDFLKLNEEQRIESILVHEKLELEAAHDGSSNPHRSAIRDAPDTDYRISDRVRRHLEIYAVCQEKMP